MNDHGKERRAFLTRTSAIGAAALFAQPTIAAAEPPPETTRFRFAHGPFICYAPQYLAEEFLRMEGFTEIEYLPVPADYTYTSLVAAGRVDLAIFGPTSALVALDSGLPLVMLAGIHAGCWELFGGERVAGVRDLRGKRIAVIGMGAVDQLWIASILAYVGIHPMKDVE
jgi:NitT/TauT family transport system substrate-binding protein